MEEQQRRALRRGRARLVAALRVEPLWEPLEQRGIFTRPMLEELQVGQGAGLKGGPHVSSPWWLHVPLGPKREPMSPEPCDRSVGWPPSPLTLVTGTGGIVLCPLESKGDSRSPHSGDKLIGQLHVPLPW